MVSLAIVILTGGSFHGLNTTSQDDAIAEAPCFCRLPIKVTYTNFH